MRSFIRVAVLAFTVVLPAKAQLTGTGTAPTAQQCDSAVQVMEVGDVNDLFEQQAAAAHVAHCGRPAIQAYASLLGRYRTSLQTTGLSPIFGAAVLDSAVYRAALALAQDAGAAPGPRALAMGILLQLTATAEAITFSELASNVEGDMCTIATSGLAVPSPGNLPANALQQVAAAVTAVERDGSAPAGVRSAANCVMNTWRSRAGLSMQTLHPSTSYSFTIEHVCGRSWRVRTTSPYPFYLRVRKVGSGVSKELHTASREAGDPFADMTFDANETGPVELLLDSDVVATGNATAPSCP